MHSVTDNIYDYIEVHFVM